MEGLSLDFLDAKMLGAITLVAAAWVQYTKEYFPSEYVKLWGIVSGVGISFLLFLSAGVPTTVVTVVTHGVVATVLGGLGYEITKGTPVGLRSTKELKPNGKQLPLTFKK